MKPRIDAQRWSEIRALFDEVVQLDDAGRRERLATIGSSDQELRQQVEALISADAEPAADLAYIETVFARYTERDAFAVDHDPLKLTGRSISHFKIGEAIAAGGMGVVYRAEDTHLHRAIALKFLLPSYHFHQDVKERFLREARAAASLDHPNICAIHEIGEMADGRLFLAMPLYEGETLKARLARDGALVVAEAISIARQITEAVRAAHRAGIVHRDLKPANVMLLPDGTVKLLDFGLAKVPDLTLTTARAVVGTVSYMSPEQIQGQPADGRADLWAIGVVLYEMLTGSRPFAGDHDVAVAHAIVHMEPLRASTLRADIGSSAEQVITTLLRKDPPARYTSADRLAAELAGIAAGSPAPSHPAAPASRRGRRVLPVPAIAVAALFVIAGLSAALLSQRKAGAGGAPRTVAVLPFSNVSGDTSTDYLSAGLSDAIALDLSRLRSLVVPGYVSVAHHRDPTKPLFDVARELGAAAVVHGSVRRIGDRVVLDIQLVDSIGNNNVWRTTYDRAANRFSTCAATPLLT